MLWSTKAKHNFTFEYQTTTHYIPSTTQNSFITTANLARRLFHIAFFVTFPTMRNHFRGIPRKIYNFRRNLTRNLREQICNRREQVVRAGCKLLRANCQSKYQHCGGSLQSCAEKNIRFEGSTWLKMPDQPQVKFHAHVKSNQNLYFLYMKWCHISSC